MSRVSKKGITSSGFMVFCPFGLLMSLATLAINLFIEIPAEAFKPVFAFIFSRISFAINVALGLPFLFSVTSK